MGRRPGKASLVKGEDTKPEKEGNLQEQSHLLCALRSLQLLPGKSYVREGHTNLARMVGSPGSAGVVLAACLLGLIRMVLKVGFPCQ